MTKIVVPLNNCDFDYDISTNRITSNINNGFINGTSVVKRTGSIRETSAASTVDYKSIYFSPDKGGPLIIGTDGANKRAYDMDGNTIVTMANINIDYGATMADVDYNGGRYIYIRSSNPSTTSSDYLLDVPGVGGAATEITDAQHPNDLVAGGNASYGVVGLDGFTFIARGNKIYNSVINNATSWDNTVDFILGNPSGGTVFEINKYQDHVVSFSAFGVNFFYNAGNPTGSPLALRKDVQYLLPIDQRRNTYVYPSSGGGGTGSTGIATVCSYQYADYLFFIAGLSVDTLYGTYASSNPKRGIFVLDNFKVTKISSNAIDSYMAANDADTFYIAGTIQFNNRPFLVVKDTSASSITLVYDIISAKWYKWTLVLTACTGQYFIQGNFNNYTHSKSGSNLIFQDNSTNYTFEVITKRIDSIKDIRGEDTFDSRKSMSTLSLTTNRPSTTTNINISYTDDDYSTFSTERTLDISNPQNTLARLGQFTERAIKLKYEGSSGITLHNIIANVHIDG